MENQGITPLTSVFLNENVYSCAWQPLACCVPLLQSKTLVALRRSRKFYINGKNPTKNPTMLFVGISRWLLSFGVTWVNNFPHSSGIEVQGQGLEKMPELDRDEEDLDYHVTFPSPTSQGGTEEEEEETEERASETREPVVVLLGWMGAQDKYLAKYSEFWQQNGYGRRNIPPPPQFIISKI